jgi:CRISPR-associated protein Cas1
MEGARVRALYATIAEREGVSWIGRNAKDAGDPINQTISIANAALYGLVEAVVLALGFSPAIGFVHSGGNRSFVYDVADCVKFSTVTPLAMRIAKESADDLEGRTRRACRDLFRSMRMAERIVSAIEGILHG